MTGRGRRHPPPAANAEDDMRAVLADIEASLTDLDRRLEDANRADREAEAKKFSAGKSARTGSLLSVEGDAMPPEPAAMEGESELLRELEAEQKVLAAAVPPERLHAQGKQLHEALLRLFRFLDQFCRRTNALGLRIGRHYRLDAQTDFTDLEWKGAFADYRKQSSGEKAWLAHVDFRVRLQAAEPVTVVRRWDRLEEFLHDLHLLNLRALDTSDLDGKPQQEYIDIRLAPDFPLQINFRGDYKAGRIEILCRNLEGFAISAFLLAPDAVDIRLLDHLGRFLLGRADTLPAALTRVQYLPPHDAHGRGATHR